MLSGNGRRQAFFGDYVSKAGLFKGDWPFPCYCCVLLGYPYLDFFGAERAPLVVRSRLGFKLASLPFLAVAG